MFSTCPSPHVCLVHKDIRSHQMTSQACRQTGKGPESPFSSESQPGFAFITSETQRWTRKRWPHWQEPSETWCINCYGKELKFLPGGSAVQHSALSQGEPTPPHYTPHRAAAKATDKTDGGPPQTPPPPPQPHSRDLRPFAAEKKAGPGPAHAHARGAAAEGPWLRARGALPAAQAWGEDGRRERRRAPARFDP